MLLISIGTILALCAWAFLKLTITAAAIYNEADLQTALADLEVSAGDAEAGAEALFEAQAKVVRFCTGAIKLCVALILLGLCLCCRAPADSKVRGVVIGATLLLTFSALVRLTFTPQREPSGWASVATCFLLAGFALFLIFLHGLGRFFGDKELARRTVRLMLFSIAAVVIALVVIPSFSTASESNPTGIWLIAFVFVAASICLVWCLRLVRAARRAIHKGPNRELETTA